MFGLSDNPLIFLFSLVSLIIAISIHEFSHAYAADRLGDPTPRLQGRLTLNPLAHLDPVGTLMIIFAHFGWGKPVLFDPFNLRNPRRDSAIISIAGPVSNFMLAGVSSVLLRIVLSTQFTLLGNPLATTVLTIGVTLLESLIILNVSLGIFNLIPIHPLDGFKIVEGILPDEYAKQWHQLEGYGMIFLLFLAFPILSKVSPLSQVISPIINFILAVLLPSGSLI